MTGRKGARDQLVEMDLMAAMAFLAPEVSVSYFNHLATLC